VTKKVLTALTDASVLVVLAFLMPIGAFWAISAYARFTHWGSRFPLGQALSIVLCVSAIVISFTCARRRPTAGVISVAVLNSILAVGCLGYVAGIWR